MKKILFVAVLAIALALGMGSVAMANYGPHGGYLADTDACAGCHRAHVAFSDLTWNDGTTDRNALLVSDATTMKEFCYACHGNDKPGAATNVQGGKLDTAISGNTQAQGGELNAVLNGGGFEFTGWGNAASAEKNIASGTVVKVNIGQKFATSQHDVDGAGTWTVGSTIWGSWGPGTNNGPGKRVDLTCTNCHDPHGSSNYRLLLDAVQNRTVGGYAGNFATAVDPLPQPWVVSNEIGYPNGRNTDGSAAPGEDVGWRLHKNTWTGMDGTPIAGEYMPDYTNAAYGIESSMIATGVNPSTDYKEGGMTGWCTRACHDQYMVIQGNLENPGTGSSYGTENFAAGTYDPGDGSGARHRHRHPMGVPLSRWYVGGVESGGPRGDRALIYDPLLWQDWDATIKFVDIPLEHNVAGTTNGGEGSPYNTYNDGAGGFPEGSQINKVTDVLECLTCHRAHGSSATMTGYAGSGSNINPSKTDGNLGTPPTFDSALLRADNRGVCERCHNK